LTVTGNRERIAARSGLARREKKMQTLMVREPRFGWYPALQDDVITPAVAAERVAYLRTCQWTITETRIVDDGKSRAESDREFRAEWAAERRRCGR
jgi:hypothetical protein